MSHIAFFVNAEKERCLFDVQSLALFLNDIQSKNLAGFKSVYENCDRCYYSSGLPYFSEQF